MRGNFEEKKRKEKRNQIYSFFFFFFFLIISENYNKQIENLRSIMNSKRDEIYLLESKITELEKQIIQLQSINDKIFILKQRKEELSPIEIKLQHEIDVLIIILIIIFQYLIIYFQELKQKLEILQKTLDTQIKEREESKKNDLNKEDQHQREKEKFQSILSIIHSTINQINQ